MFHYNTTIKFTLYMHLQSCGRTLWSNNTCAIQHINSCSRTVWILIDSCDYEVMDSTTLTTSCPQSHNCSYYLFIPNMQNFLISIFYWLLNKSWQICLYGCHSLYNYETNRNDQWMCWVKYLNLAECVQWSAK